MTKDPSAGDQKLPVIRFREFLRLQGSMLDLKRELRRSSVGVTVRRDVRLRVSRLLSVPVLDLGPAPGSPATHRVIVCTSTMLARAGIVERTQQDDLKLLVYDERLSASLSEQTPEGVEVVASTAAGVSVLVDARTPLEMMMDLRRREERTIQIGGGGAVAFGIAAFAALVIANTVQSSPGFVPFVGIVTSLGGMTACSLLAVRRHGTLQQRIVSFDDSRESLKPWEYDPLRFAIDGLSRALPSIEGSAQDEASHVLAWLRAQWDAAIPPQAASFAELLEKVDPKLDPVPLIWLAHRVLRAIPLTNAPSYQNYSAVAPVVLAEILRKIPREQRVMTAEVLGRRLAISEAARVGNERVRPRELRQRLLSLVAESLLRPDEPEQMAKVRVWIRAQDVKALFARLDVDPALANAAVTAATKQLASERAEQQSRNRRQRK